MHVLDEIGRGLLNAVEMGYQVLWALLLGFLLSAAVQAWVPRRRLESALGGRGVKEAFLASGLGAASSSCSYAAVALARSLFAKGASLASALAFQFASTNLVFEIGVVMWVFLGWRFTVAELVGGLVLIALMWGGVRLFVSRRLEDTARLEAQAATVGHQHVSVGSEHLSLRRLVTVEPWSDVAHNFRGDVEMLYREITLGFLISGFVSLLPQRFFNALFLSGHGHGRIVENVIIGPLVAILSFVCSVGNIPLAAVLWSSGISFAGVLAFIYADLVIVPILLIYRKFYGLKVTVRIVSLMLIAMALAALAVDGLFAALGLAPKTRPSLHAVSEHHVSLNYTTLLDILFAALALGLWALTLRRGVQDPVCGMTVDRKTPQRTEHEGHLVYFCSAHCKQRFDAEPERFSDARRAESAPAELAGGHQAGRSGS